MLTTTRITSQSHSPCSQLLAERDIDGFLTLDSELVSPAEWGGFLPMAANSGRGLLNLCIADANKDCERQKPYVPRVTCWADSGCYAVLLNCSKFIPHLISGLLLDPEHPRKDTAETIKTMVQRDFAEYDHTGLPSLHARIEGL